jgi:hypothetical protein
MSHMTENSQTVEWSDSMLQEQLPDDAAVVGFSHEGTTIVNPFYDESMRVRVDPAEYYGFEITDMGAGDWAFVREIGGGETGNVFLFAPDGGLPATCPCNGWILQYGDVYSEYGTHPIWEIRCGPDKDGLGDVRVHWWSMEVEEDAFNEADPYLLACVAIGEMDLLKMEKLHFHLGEMIAAARAKRDLESDIRMVAEAAQEAFWKVVARMFPEIKTGDLDIGASVEFTDACRRVVGLWVETNTPEED